MKKRQPIKPDSELQLNHAKVIALKKKVESQRKRLKRLRQNNSASVTRRVTNSRKDIDMLKSMSSRYLKPETHQFFCGQLDRSLIKKGKWTTRDKSNAISMYHSSPKLYRLLQKQFCLPSIKTLNRTMKTIDIFPGFPPQVLDAFKIKVSYMPTLNMTNVVVVFEKVFQSEINKVIKLKKVRELLSGHLLSLPECKNLKRYECGCTTVEYIAFLFTTIRLHHELKLKTTTFKESKGQKRILKKNRKLAKLQHN